MADILRRDAGYGASVAFGLSFLRETAAENLTAKLGVRFVEAVQSITNEAVDKLRRYAAHGESHRPELVDWMLGLGITTGSNG